MSEQEFNDRLKQIGDRYESAKDILNGYITAYPDSPIYRDTQRLYKINLEMRDIAATTLKELYEKTKQS